MRYWLTLLFVLLPYTVQADTTTIALHGGKSQNRHKKYTTTVIGNDHLKLDQWSGECFFNIDLNHPGFQIHKNQRGQIGDTVQWSAPWGGYKIYNLNWGGDLEEDPQGIEWMMWLNSEPPVNAITLNFSYQGLTFYYQPPLPYANGTVDSVFIADTLVGTKHRPDSVVGSYAVYHATRSWDWVVLDNNGDTVTVEEYRNGKAFHIYRPKAFDATNDTIWCDINIDTVASTLTLTVDPVWLAAATYPVIIDPVIGDNSTSSSTSSFTNGTGFATRTSGRGYVASSGDVVTDLNHYSACNGAGDRDWEYTLYIATGSNWAPDSCFYVDTLADCGGADTSWHSITGLSVSLTAGDTLQVAASRIVGDGNSLWLWDTGSSGDASADFTGTDKCPWTEQATPGELHSIYATVTSGGGADSTIIGVKP